LSTKNIAGKLTFVVIGAVKATEHESNMNLQFQDLIGAQRESQCQFEKTILNINNKQLTSYRSLLSKADNLPSYCAFAHAVYE